MGSSAFKQYVYHYDKQGQKKSIPDSYRDPTRYLKTSNQKESMMEKPYLTGDYKRMHLAPPPDSEYKPDDWWPPIPDTNLPLWVFGTGKKQFVTHTIIWGKPYCYLHTWLGGCASDGETFEFSTFVAHGFNQDLVKISSQGDDIIKINDDNTIKMTGNTGTAVICATFEAEIPGTTVLTAEKGTMPVIPFPFPTEGIKVSGKGSQAFQRHDTNKKVSIDCGCDEIENCTAGDACGGAVGTVDEGSTPQTIGANDTATITFTTTPPAGCSCGPYDWSVEYPLGTADYGAGFSVDSAQTETPAVGITTSGGDGTGIIVMTDQCGNTLKYEVRCTAGKWWNCCGGCGSGTCTDSEYCDPLDFTTTTINLEEIGEDGANHFTQVKQNCRDCPYPECRAGSEECTKNTCASPWYTKEIDCSCGANPYQITLLNYWGR